MGANHARVGAYPSPNLAETWKNSKNYNCIEKFVIRIPKQGLFQDSNSGGVGWIYGGVTKNWFQPVTSRGYVEHWELYATREYIYELIHGMAKQVTHPFWAFPDLSEDRWARREGIPLWEARWNTLQTWPGTCKHGSGSPTAANQPDKNGETSNSRALIKQSLVGWLEIRQMDGWMVGRSVGDRLDSKPAGWFNWPTDWIANKPGGKPTTDHKSDQQTNQPSDRLAINPTTDNPSIRPTANQPTKHSSYKRSVLEFLVLGFDVPPFLSGRLHGGCITTRVAEQNVTGQNVADKMLCVQNVIGQNVSDKMSRTKCYVDKMSLDKMSRTKCRGQYVVDKMLWTKSRHFDQ